MSLTLLDGTNANIDLTIGGSSFRCQLSSMAIEMTRDLLQRVTFCSSNFKEKIPSLKEVRGVASGFVGKSDATAKLGAFILDDTAVAIVATFDTGCTIGFTAQVTRDSGGTQAAGLSSRTIEFESINDDLAVTWVTT